MRKKNREKEIKRQRERERERDKEKERERSRQTDRQRQTVRESQIFILLPVCTIITWDISKFKNTQYLITSKNEKNENNEK